MTGKEVLKNFAMSSNREVKVDLEKPRRHTHGPCTVLSTLEDNRRNEKIPSRRTDFSYVNSAYSGSESNISGGNRVSEQPCSPPTEVYREQYWACSRWPFTQKLLSFIVGLIIGAIIGMFIPYAVRSVRATDVIGGIFSVGPPAGPATE